MFITDKKLEIKRKLFESYMNKVNYLIIIIYVSMLQFTVLLFIFIFNS